MTLESLVKKYDPENQFQVLKNSFQQIEYAWNNKFDLSRIETSKIENIVITGLGGSAIAADLLRNFLNNELTIPLQVNRGYSLPKFVNENSLVITSSYSGNTEETIFAFNDAVKKKAQIIAVTTGGEIENLATKNNIPIIKLKSDLQPRYALGLSFFSLLKIFQSIRLIDSHDEFTNKTISDWKKLGEEFSNEKNIAVDLATQLIGALPIIYADGNLNDSIASRFKAQLNENSKLHAFVNFFPELNHNEIIGWETADKSGIRFVVIFIEDSDSHPQVQKRFKLTEELIIKAGMHVVKIRSDHKSFKERLLHLVFLVDWISYYAAILRRKDPSEIDFIHLLKKKLVD